jgi:hypothetical protein
MAKGDDRACYDCGWIEIGGRTNGIRRPVQTYLNYPCAL